ncbi:MAG: alpha-L-rhamnosidase domain protein [Actinomycetia bacterium]|nr:alpha-L-rhamnosidase domain protein [Actinomycetes bacterium]
MNIVRCAPMVSRAVSVAVVVVILGASSAGTTVAAAVAAAAVSPSRPSALTVDGLSHAIGIAPTDVQFAWHVGDTRPDAVQRAYRIVVRRGATSVWDSGRVVSSEQAFVAYTGPALEPAQRYQWRVQTWAASGGPGPFAGTAVFETGLRDQDWNARWIRRPADDSAGQDEYTFLRKEFTLRRSPIVRARVSVSGDQQYELSVNGVRAGKGQAFSDPDVQYYETLDITGLLRAGAANAIGIVNEWQGPTKGRPGGAPGAIAQVSVLHRDGSTEAVTTDGTWRVTAGNWLPGAQRDKEGDLVDHVENIDGRHEPLGWTRPGFDDRSWAPATVLGPAGTAPWTHLVPVRTRIVEEPVHALSLQKLANGAVVADFGKVYAAVPTVTFHHGSAGHVVTMRAGFLLDQPTKKDPTLIPTADGIRAAPGQVSALHGTQHTDMSYSYVQRSGAQTFHPFDYLGFRYLQIDDPGERLTPADVVARTRHVAVPDEHAATFTSSNRTADAVFELGRHSALFTAQEQFVDTPTREKGSWLYDGYNESQTAMAAFGDQNETRKSLLEFAQSAARYWPAGGVNKIYPTGLGALDINESTEIYVEWVWRYWLETGDRSLLAAVYPAVTGVTDYVARAIDPATGLVTDLPSTSVYYPWPTVTRLNVLGANAFRRAADIAAVLQRPATEVSAQRNRADALATAVNARLTRPDGIYVDGLDAAGNQTTTALQSANTAAIAYGVVPATRAQAVGRYVAGLGVQNVPSNAGELFEALRLTGQDGAFLTRLTDPRSQGYAQILAEGATFTWEVWHPSDAIGDTMSHGWGSNILVEIQRELLGVAPTGPGFSTFTVRPPATGLSQAAGRIPTPHGAIKVAWHRANGKLTLDVTVPPNTKATVQVPSTSGASGTRTARLVGAGEHRFGVALARHAP